MAGLLEGIRVLEVSTWLAGPALVAVAMVGLAHAGDGSHWSHRGQWAVVRSTGNLLSWFLTDGHPPKPVLNYDISLLLQVRRRLRSLGTNYAPKAWLCDI